MPLAPGPARGVLALASSAAPAVTPKTETRAEFVRGFKENQKFREIMNLMEITPPDLEAVFGILDSDASRTAQNHAVG